MQTWRRLIDLYIFPFFIKAGSEEIDGEMSFNSAFTESLMGSGVDIMKGSLVFVSLNPKGGTICCT
jgi:hypothetical protein